MRRRRADGLPGSLHLEAASHPPCEHGTTSLFGVIGQLRQGPTVVGGQLVPRWRAGLRLPYDKRIEEGLSARHPLEGLQRLVQDPAALGA